MDTVVKQRSTALRLADLWALTKPRQTLLLLVTGVCSYTLSRGLPIDSREGLQMALGLLCAISGCTVLNMLLDRDIDSEMRRTADRPLPSRSVSPLEALLLGGLLSVVGLALSFSLDLTFGLVVASGFTADLLVYTAWLKRRTPLSIIFGGISGGMPVLAGRVLALGRLDGIGILLASSVLLWFPSHILTLAIRHAADYERAGVPVWPNVYGGKATRLVIATANLLNTLVLTGAGLLLHIERWALLGLLGMSLGCSPSRHGSSSPRRNDGTGYSSRRPLCICWPPRCWSPWARSSSARIPSCLPVHLCYNRLLIFQPLWDTSTVDRRRLETDGLRRQRP